MTQLWQIDIYPAPGQPDPLARGVIADAVDLGVSKNLQVATARGFLLQGPLTIADARRLANELFADAVVERSVVAAVGDPKLNQAPATNAGAAVIHVLPKPGVMDPVAQSAVSAVADFGLAVEAVRTFRKYWVSGCDTAQQKTLAAKLLANDAIEQVVFGPLSLDQLQLGAEYRFKLIRVPLRSLDDAGLTRLSKERQLYLTLIEMQTIQAHFRQLERDPTDVELDTIAQTWSEHCSHKTLAGRIAYRDERGERRFQNMLKETIFAATQEIRRQLGDDDWCVSVFRDNAGIIRFDDQYNVCFKVETHNHPSALEPYGGANTGLGGVIRDPLGTGLGAKPICNTDVFCFAPPDTPADSLPPGVLHPRRVMKGVVSGVRDYGNRMGIPTVNGAVFFDRRYLGNPLVYCGNVGLIPRDKSFKEPQAGDWIVAIGGATGRDGIHGATFSSAELTSASETESGGAVQIGNAITEKMMLDVILAARDRNLYHAITDCGAGGFSSAVGEMGADIGAEVWLDRAPLKYDGLSYSEIWISEAQERMVLAVGPDQWTELQALCQAEGVTATILGKFVPTGRLRLLYQENEVADLEMEFLHEGRPPAVREAVYEPLARRPLSPPRHRIELAESLAQILGSPNVASKEWIIRQYDHEVQAGSVIKPLVGVANDGPSDAAVVRPVLGSQRGIVIACGMNPRYGDFDPQRMAASAIDEAIRNCVAVGADPERIAILDNFCWGYTDRPETLGSLVRAAMACHDVAIAFRTPFISGKDSLNNEFSYEVNGDRRTLTIPPSLLISAIGQIADVRRCVTMDLKTPGNRLYQVGMTRNELGGSHYALVTGRDGGDAPLVELELAAKTFSALHQAIQAGLVRACHDLSEGGLAVSVAEMAFSGGYGARIEIDRVPHQPPFSAAADERAAELLFSESNSRFVCEVPQSCQAEFERRMTGIPLGCLGEVTELPRLVVSSGGATLIDANLAWLKETWQRPLRF